MITWTRSAPAFGGYYEHAVISGKRVTLRNTANNRWTASIDGVKVRGSWRELDAAKTAVIRHARGCGY
jgi:hypothetical protein